MSHHPGSRLSALVDGRLDARETERVLAHVARCPGCAALLHAERQARRMLSAARDVEPGPDLTARLLALRPRETTPPEAPHPQAGSRRWSDGAGFADSVRLPGEPAPAAAGYLRGDVVGGRRVSALVGVAGCLALVLAGLVALGDRPVVSPQTHRAHALRVLAEAVDSHAAPGPDTGAPVGALAATVVAAPVSPDARGGADGDAATAAPRPSGEVVMTGADAATAAAWLARHDWAVPTGLPEGWTVEAVRRDVHAPGDVEIDLEGPHGTVVVLQQRGRLAPDGVAGLPVLDLADRRVHVASRDPWHVVWQCDDVVVSVLAEGGVAAVGAVVGAHEQTGYDDGVPARIVRGWTSLAGAWSP